MFLTATKTMFDEAAHTYPTTIKSVPECYETQEMCYKTVDRCFLYLILSLINIKLKKYLTKLFLYISFL